MIAGVEAVTEVVAMVKVALVAPAGTMILTGTVAAIELHESETDPPALSAGALKVTVPVDEVPPTTLIGLNDTVERTGPGGGGGGAGGGFRFRAARTNTPSVPVMMTCVGTPTTLVFTVKVAMVVPTGTVMLAGTVAAAKLLESVTTDPPAAAGKSRVTVPVETPPPTRLEGVKKRLLIDGGFTNSRPCTVAPS